MHAVQLSEVLFFGCTEIHTASVMVRYLKGEEVCLLTSGVLHNGRSQTSDLAMSRWKQNELNFFPSETIDVMMIQAFNSAC